MEQVEQKKEYTAPEMKIVELNHQVSLMSDSDPISWDKELL